MKKNISLVLCSIICFKSFCQADTSNTLPVKPATDYSALIQKSKNQKTAAWILLGSGTAMTVSGLILWNNENERKAKEDPLGSILSFGYNDWVILWSAGIVAATGSIPFFITSGKNKRKAKTLSASFKMEKASLIHGYSLSRLNYPALSVKIAL